jgi:hypothetical protein
LLTMKLTQSAGGALRDGDVDQLARARSRVEHPGLHHQLFPAGREALSAVLKML